MASTSAANCDYSKRRHSRIAAKSRRFSEAELFAELAEYLPRIERPTIYQMDRMAVMRLILSMCKLKRISRRCFPIECNREASFPTDLPSLDGFIMVINKTGQLLFVTCSVADCIGFTQADLIGRYLRDYVNLSDWPRLRERLCKSGRSASSMIDLDMDDEVDENGTFFRMKTALTARGGRARKLTVAVQEPLRAFVIKPRITRREGPHRAEEEENRIVGGDRCEDILFVHCLPFDLSSTRRAGNSNRGCQEMTSRHELNMRFRSCDENLAKLLHIETPKSVYGRSFFDMVHPADLRSVGRSVKRMLDHGHSVTGYYRLSTGQNDQYIWMITEMQLLVQNIRGVHQNSVVCKHVVLSTTELQSSISDPTTAMLVTGATSTAADFSTSNDSFSNTPSSALNLDPDLFTAPYCPSFDNEPTICDAIFLASMDQCEVTLDASSVQDFELCDSPPGLREDSTSSTMCEETRAEGLTLHDYYFDDPQSVGFEFGVIGEMPMD